MAESLWRRLGGPRALGWTGLAVAVVAGGDLALRKALSAGVANAGGAAWIWAEAGEAPFAPNAFFAVRDFELASLPASARLKAVADEEMVVFLNGAAVGSGRYEEGAGLAVWEVAELLRAGANRLTIELRSGRGVGGLLAVIEADGDEIVASDAGWRILREFEDGLLEVGSALSGGAPPRVWPRGSSGRWGAPGERPSRPLQQTRLAGLEGVFAPRVRPLASTEWIDLGPADWRSPAISDRVIFDWGREMVGYPSVVFAGTAGARGLLWAGLEPPGASGPVTSYLIKAPGRRPWTDSEPLRLRYLIVHSTVPVTGARVFELGEAEQSSVGAPAQPVGAFGLEPALSVPSVENEIRRELEGVSRVAGR